MLRLASGKRKSDNFFGNLVKLPTNCFKANMINRDNQNLENGIM